MEITLLILVLIMLFVVVVLLITIRSVDVELKNLKDSLKKWNDVGMNYPGSSMTDRIRVKFRNL